MSDKIGLFTGSFDPMTNGHLDMIERASRLFDKLYVGIFFNPHKQGFLPLENRKRGLEKALEHLGNVEVVFHMMNWWLMLQKTGGYLSGTRLEKCNGFAI